MVDLNAGIRAYERGFYMRNDYHNGINFAYLLNVLSAESAKRADSPNSPEEAVALRADAIACFVYAADIRQEVLQICERVIAEKS